MITLAQQGTEECDELLDCWDVPCFHFQGNLTRCYLDQLCRYENNCQQSLRLDKVKRVLELIQP